MKKIRSNRTQPPFGKPRGIKQALQERGAEGRPLPQILNEPVLKKSHFPCNYLQGFESFWFIPCKNFSLESGKIEVISNV